MKGVWNRILRVDLTKKKITTEEVPDIVYEYFLGGPGLGHRFLYHEVPADVGPFDPGNRLIFATGIFHGIAQTGAGKWSVIARNPLSNINGEAAATGSFGITLKRTGYDAIIFQGKAEKPTYLWLTEDTAELRDASYLWGKDSYYTNDTLIKDIGEQGVQVACIGQGAERLVRYSCIGHENRSYASRTGMGAVMGSKNLKAVAVKGSKEVEYADPDRLAELNKEINKKVYESGVNMRTHGTAFAAVPFNERGNLPIKNWRLGSWDEGVKLIGAPRYTEYLQAKPWPCLYCTLGCHRKITYRWKGETITSVGPEYETFAMLGFNCMVDDLDAICKANDLANMYTLDTISLGSVLAWAMESYEKGVITKEDTEGLELTWGNAEAMVEMVRRIGLRETKLGWLLGEGVKRASEAIGKGSEAWAIQQKGNEIAAHDPRAAFVAGLAYCTDSSRGPCHERGNPQHLFIVNLVLPELGKPTAPPDERWSWKNAEVTTAIYQDWNNIVNSLGHCKFMFFANYTMTDILNTFNAATGLNWSMQQLRKAGERIYHLCRLLNIRYGITKKDDLAHPRRLLEEPKTTSESAYKLPTVEGITKAIEAYYKHRGMDENGVPTKEKLTELGLYPNVP
ncbi:MAG: aldehyde ferredoxin oxidoreductase family protein [Candidatus Bathyarchaeia archaeon]|nr:aldehyde ferredoxin oxidoreductase family protein [Candidatus Bathyarchaeota archaeon]